MDETENYIDRLQRQIESLEQEKSDISRGSNVQSAMLQQQQQNLVEWQLDISQELSIIAHMLRGHVIKRDKEGNEFWSEPEDAEQRIFNEKGSQEIEKVVRNYLFKNLLLSNYGVEEINQRVQQFANRLRRFIYMNFEEFGMDTEYKQKHFEMIVMNITDIIEAAYLRALGGEERRSLRENIQVTQTGNIGNQPYYPAPPPKTTGGGSKLNPLNWFR